MNAVVLFTLCAAGSLVLALVLWFEVRRTQRAVPRLIVTTGVVRELESVLTERAAASVKSATLVQVDFSVAGKSYCCRTLRLFAGNRHIGDVGKKFDFPPGQQVGVYYDPEDPRRNALLVDKPRYDMPVVAVTMGVFFAVLAIVNSVKL
jgi:hypothetical protein